MKFETILRPYDQVKLYLFIHFHNFSNNGFRLQGFYQVSAKIMTDTVPHFIDRNSVDHCVYRKNQKVDGKNFGPRQGSNQIEDENVFNTSPFFISSMGDLVYLNEGIQFELNLSRKSLKNPNIKIVFQLKRYNIKMDYGSNAYLPDMPKVTIIDTITVSVPSLKSFSPYYMPIIFTDKYNYSSLQCSLSSLYVLPFEIYQFDVDPELFLNFYKKYKTQYSKIYKLLTDLFTHVIPNTHDILFGKLSSEFPPLTSEPSFRSIVSLLPITYKLWTTYINSLSTYSNSMYFKLYKNFQDQFRPIFNHFLVRDDFNPDKLIICDAIKSDHIKIANEIRSKPLPEPTYLIPFVIDKLSEQPIFFVSNHYSRDSISKDNANHFCDICKIKYIDNQKLCYKCHTNLFPKKPEINVIILLHGLQGNCWGMKLIRDYLSMHLPNYEFINCTSFEKTSEEKISVSADNAVNEIVSQLNIISGRDFTKINSVSFVVHSLGGLILQAVMAKLPPKMSYGNLLSLSVPYLGTKYGSSLTSTGIQILKFWNKKVGSLNEMDFSDEKDFKQTYLYSLASNSDLKQFRHLIFVSSPEDRFVPYGSPRIQICQSAIDDNRNGQHYQQMISNYLKGVDENNIHHFDISYNFGFSLDSAIGRKAHNECLEDRNFMYRFMNEIEPYFTELSRPSN